MTVQITPAQIGPKTRLLARLESGELELELAAILAQALRNTWNCYIDRDFNGPRVDYPEILYVTDRGHILNDEQADEYEGCAEMIGFIHLITDLESVGPQDRFPVLECAARVGELPRLSTVLHPQTENLGNRRAEMDLYEKFFAEESDRELTVEDCTPVADLIAAHLLSTEFAQDLRDWISKG